MTLQIHPQPFLIFLLSSWAQQPLRRIYLSLTSSLKNIH